MKYVLAGSGAVALALMDELSRRDAELIILNRTGTLREKVPANCSVFSVDLRDPNACIPFLKNADTVIHAAGGVSISNEDIAALMTGIAAGAERAACPLFYVDTMDAYGDNFGIPMSEASPERPSNPREKARSEAARFLLTAHSEGRIKATIARASDLYGPRVLHGALGEDFFGPIIQGKKGALLGRLDMPHSWTFVRDLARSLVTLLDNDNAVGKIWHIPSPQPITQKQVLDIVRDMGNRNAEATTVGSSRMGIQAFFNPSLRQVQQILYRYEKPWIVNHSKFATTFGERTTTHVQALFETVEWFKRRAGIERRYGF